MEHAISDSEAPRRFNTVLISSFAAAALLLAILGIYSVIAFTVAMRVHEMAIRMALGSQRSGIVGLVLLSGLKLAAAGSIIGLAGAIAASRLLKTFVFGVSTLDPLVLVVAAVAGAPAGDGRVPAARTPRRHHQSHPGPARGITSKVSAANDDTRRSTIIPTGGDRKLLTAAAEGAYGSGDGSSLCVHHHGRLGAGVCHCRHQ